MSYLGFDGIAFLRPGTIVRVQKFERRMSESPAGLEVGTNGWPGSDQFIVKTAVEGLTFPAVANLSGYI